ncbi:hypothetical protein H8V75_11640 [Enterobacter roggenkampii]|uniref:hypothetical protein n=1 Tax=Enterobacter roggenkampii TaxID=1812935 RepID=UPI001E284E5E|nr:hypothetical protein [Enterobacter roggenkampii]MCC7579577.1 hypothetical protein [Enterobacter roggenkampii]MCC7588904.1 hypothetical protein [Enterobacter roggenkampii]MCC7593501.1 hypothetical protein [Enterobacter roggenkampii]MCC7603025.1 hypothetical protein [Enterobacter roggenkampii]MCC7608327.1 hypothetical protein [Enterobacter roggenkampii]
MDTNQQAQGLILPIEVNYPLSLAFDPSTGGLVIEYWSHQGGQIGSVRMRLLLDAQSTEQLLSSLPTLQKEFGELVAARANKGFLQ